MHRLSTSKPLLVPSIAVLLFTMLCAFPAAAQSGLHTPKAGSPERTALMDALRVPVQRDLNQEVKFVVSTLNVFGEWAFLSGTPQRKNGKDIDFSITKYASAYEDGMYENNVFALFRNLGGRWVVVTYALGCTDVCYEGWARKYKAPSIIFP